MYKPEWLVSELDFESVDEKIDVITEALKIVIKEKFDDISGKRD